MGPLTGLRIVEFAAIGPVPFCAMLLADMGADIVRIDRRQPADLGSLAEPKYQLANRSRKSIALDLKDPADIDVARQLVAKADALIEGFRPGVMERLDLGPEAMWEINPKLVYGRMTGWGQDGPLSQAAGHDINYISLVGALHSIGERDRPPVVPLNLVGDYGGGSLYLAIGLLAALIEARQSGSGQVVDAAMVDGAASLMTSFYGAKVAGSWIDERGSNAVDGGSFFYGPYETKDGKYISIAPIERRFYGDLLDRLGLRGEIKTDQMDKSGWEENKAKLSAVFRSKTRAEWCDLLEGTDVCFAPVLDFEEAMQHPHNRARNVFVEIDGVRQPAPAPRFSRTKSAIKGPPSLPGENTDEVLAEWDIRR